MKNRDSFGKFTTFSDSLVGKKYGKLTVIKPAGKSKCGARLWQCRCDCGNEVVVQTAQLNNGRKTNCGCVQRENFVKNISPLAHKANKKYKNSSSSRIYNCWQGMIHRCENLSDEFFASYGGRGIKVCEEWHNFDTFADWAMSNGYADNLTIDRINVDGNYCPENCRWATNKEQANNKRNTKYFEYEGKLNTLSQLAETFGVPYKRLYERVMKQNWDIERALTTEKITPSEANSLATRTRDVLTGRYIKMEVA